MFHNEENVGISDILSSDNSALDKFIEKKLNNQMNIASKIAKESTITFSGMVYGNMNRYLYTALLARWVGVEYLGIYSLANAIMLIGEVIAKMGLEILDKK